MALDLSGVTGLLAQAKALETQANTLPPGPAKDILNAQVAAIHAQAEASLSHMQQQVEAQSTILDNLNLWQTLNSLGSAAPAIIGLFVRH